VYLPVLDSVPPSFEVDRDRTRANVTLPLTMSADGLEQIALEVRLWRGHWTGIEMHEFKFVIIRLNTVTGEIEEIFDRHSAAPYIAEVRGLVLPCVCAAARALIAAVAPKVIYRATYLTRPPEKSLPKHQMITDTIVDLGYGVLQDGTDSNRRRFWLMTKSGDA
jgi:hypothetical protein